MIPFNANSFSFCKLQAKRSLRVMAEASENYIFDTAVAFINQTNQNLFLTGKAGTGKTTFLKHIKANSFKKMAILAPTGVAAINASGVTIHSFFNLPFGTFLPTTSTVWGNGNTNIYNKRQIFERTRLNNTKRDLIKSLDLIVIDEISMVRADIIDAIDTILKGVKRNDRPFGGIQMLFIGDMFQLPPVVKPQEWQEMEAYYDSPFFFDSTILKDHPPLYLELKKIYRQKDETFINILNHIRNNECTQDDMEILLDYYNPYFNPHPDEKFITLTTHNSKADHINQSELDRLSTESIDLEAKIEKNFPENAYPAERLLKLKVGAQIMFIKNDKGENRRYYNGKIGIIENIERFEKKIYVRFPGEPDILEIEKETWRNLRYDYDTENDEVKEEELGTFTQFPIRLAWAVTIHKSQGLTFDKAIVDAGQAFAAGQVYVALSRLTNLKGLILKSRITRESILTDTRIIEFAKQEMNEGTLEKSLNFSRSLFIEDTLRKAFDWDGPLGDLAAFSTSLLQRQLTQKESTMQLFEQITEINASIYKAMMRFRYELNDLLAGGKNYYDHLSVRVNAAADWILKQWNEPVITVLKNHLIEMQKMPRTKKYISELQPLILKFERRKILVEQAKSITESLSSGLPLADIFDKVEAQRKSASNINFETIPSEEKTKKEPRLKTQDITLQLFKEGKSIEDIASERAMAQSTIWGHITTLIQSGEIDISEVMSLSLLDEIQIVLKEHLDLPLKEVKEMLPEHIGYNEIRAVKAFIEKASM